MRTAPTALKNWLPTANVAWRCDLYTITLLDGTVWRWTSAEFPILSGGLVYASGPVLGRTIRQGLLPEIDTCDLQLAGAHPMGSATLAMLALQGCLDDARLQLDHIVGSYPGDLSMGVIPSWFAGRISGVEPTPTGVKVTAKSDLEELSILQLPRFHFSPQCGHTVYDANCGAVKAPFTTAGTVAAGGTLNATTFRTSITSHVDNYYNLGVLQFTAGALVGTRRAVQSYAQTNGVMTLALPMSAAPAVGDTFTVYPGCSRTWVTCSAVFANTARIRSFPHIPASTAGGQ